MAADYHLWSCNKIRNFLENKRAEWFTDNISLAEVQLIRKKIYECSPEVYARMSRFFGFVEQSIARKK